ncbi:DMP19 family protein [Prevotella sp. KH2C16]|uniref:DMP19 family protein n=1 Tax=Prevotella sp. KH2C16 TaxID=1855325 RepID=UPI0008E255CC|nr:DMP19 family protein [Prevotella sp. KH2C16]SFG11909.1 protein of unknown function [Prevotella sp. KH2C16]
MKEVKIQDSVLKEAAEAGMDEFVGVFLKAIHESIGGSLSAENMRELSSDQITLLAWEALHDEVMDGGFVQLIHNGWGAFIFRNPFDKAIREWGLTKLCTLIRRGHKLYFAHHEEIERDCTDEEFMALFEKYPAFDDLDDEFLEQEEHFVAAIAHYIDEHIENFAIIEQ